MRATHTSALIATATLLALSATGAKAQPAEQWVRLGCKEVGFQVDRDIIPVGRRDGRFSAIRLRAEGNNVFMVDLKVIYGNGVPDDIPVRAEIRAGGGSGKLDLRGRDRAIDHLQIVYRSQPNFRGRATVCADGLALVGASPPPPPPPVAGAPVPPAGGAWVRLGCRDVSFQIDRDVVRVGKRDGRFRAIRIAVGGNDIFMADLKVIYGSGNPDDIPVKAQIRAGATSGKLDLRGAARNISSVEMVYRAIPDFRGRAEVCVDGQPG